MVRLSITRRGGWRAWAQTSGNFERSLAELAGKTVMNCCAAFRMPMSRALGVPMVGDGIAPPGKPGGAI
jgi:hypothetical protein